MRILVIEDESPVAEGIRVTLEAEGHAVDLAADGEQGLWLAREHDYDAIVLDIMLPKMNGFLVCRTLREEDIWSPVLMLTAKDGELDEAEGLDTGADDYLRKPFAPVVLVARLRALMRRRGRERPVTLVAGDLQLDPATRRVTRGEVELDLTAREFSIIEVLMRRLGEVVSKQEILDGVWDFAFDGDINIVEVYVSSLRRKVDVPFERNAIETVRGAGYRLRVDGG